MLVCLKIGKVPILKKKASAGDGWRYSIPHVLQVGKLRLQLRSVLGPHRETTENASTSICQVQPQLRVWQEQTSQERDRTMKTTCVVAIPLPCPVLDLSRDLRRTWLWIRLPGYSTALPEHPWKARFLITPPTRIGMEGPSLIMG